MTKYRILTIRLKNNNKLQKLLQSIIQQYPIKMNEKGETGAESPEVISFKYPLCNKGGFHGGQSLNLVCLQPKCIQKCVICGICYEEEHKSHKIKPVKVVINSSKKYLQHLTPMNIDSKALKQSINSSKKNIITKYQQFEEQMKSSMASIKNNINGVYIKVLQQIDLKTGSNQELIRALEELKSQEMQTDKFIKLVQKLIAGVPLDSQEEDSEVSGKEIEDAVIGITKKMEKELDKKSQAIKKILQSFIASLQKTVDNPSIFDRKIEFKFSGELKHNGVELISENVIKSTEAYNYHFGLMEPSIMEKGNKPQSVAFKVRENNSNWLAVGLCHKNIVQSNNYQFSYSTLGHGGYMISSNGGSWSSIDSSKNNIVSSFHFAKNDTILVNYLPDESKVVFSKKGTEDTHTLQFENKDDDELYLCGLFYYNNDEIQFLGPDQE